MKFNYQTRTKKGEIRTGQIEASSKETAATLLQKPGIYITFLEAVEAPFYAQKIKIFERVSRKDIVLFSRQLAIMFRAKAPLVESLKVLFEQTKNVDFQEKILKLSKEVEGGTSLSKALALYPQVFSSFYVAMVRSGEVSGKLSESLDYLAEHLEREYHLLARAKGALIYPCLIVFVVVLVLLLMIFFVIPQLTEVLEGTGQPLPIMTRLTIDLTAGLKNWGFLIIIIMAAAAIFGFRYYLTENGKKFFHRIFLKIPIIGELLKMIYTARFAENLSTLISGGLPIVRALAITGDIIGNVSYKEAIFKTRDAVKKGETISSVLFRYSELFPPVFIQMVLIGERTGTLDSTLMNIVSFYQKETDRTIDNALSILEPALIIFLGLVVAGLMLSVLMPLYQIAAL